MPKSYWGGAGLTTTHVINQLPSKILGFKVPWKYSHWFILIWEPSIISFLRYLGVSFVYVHIPNKGKLNLRVVKCIFVRYSWTLKGYKCYHPSSNFILFYFLFFIFILVDVLFNESEFYFSTPYLYGGIPLRKTRIEIPVSLSPFSLMLLKCLIQYLYPSSLNLSRYPLSLLLRIEWLVQCPQGRKLQSLDLYKFKNLNRLLEMR